MIDPDHPTVDEELRAALRRASDDATRRAAEGGHLGLDQDALYAEAVDIMSRHIETVLGADFAGMTDDEFEAFLRDRLAGHRRETVEVMTVAARQARRRALAGQ